MPECHKCEHDGKRSEACLTCRGAAETNHKGRSHVSIDAGGAQTLGEVEAARAEIAARRFIRRGKVGTEAAEVVRVMLSLSVKDFALVKALLAGKSMADVAREDGKTRAAVSDRVRKLVGRHPVFKFLRRNF